MNIAIGIAVSALSLLGVFLIIRVAAASFFTSKQIAACVIVESKGQLCELDMLLPDAASALFAVRNQRLAVIVPSELWESCEEKERLCAKEMARAFSAELYISEKQK